MNNSALHYSEAAIHRFLSKGDFLKFCNIHRKSPPLESLFKKVADLTTSNLIKKRLEHRYFPVDNEKFLRAAFL